MRVSIALKPFLHGLAVVALFYIALLSFIWIHGSSVLSTHVANLASTTVPVEREVVVVEPPAPEPLPVVDLDAPTGNTPLPPEQAVPYADIPAASLPIAPLEGFYETAGVGTLPKRNADGTTPFTAYRRPFTITGTPIVALIVDDYGLSDSVSLKALEAMPADVTFMLSAYSSDPEKWSGDARSKGHEIWMKVNFETAGFPDNADPGPQALLANASLKYNEDRLIWHMTRAAGYAGIAAGTDYIFESASSILQPLIKFTYNRGVGFFETNPVSSPLIETLAANAQSPYAKADIWLTGIESQDVALLKILEDTARERGFAIGIVRPYDASFPQIKLWIDSLAHKGLTLAPVSAIAALPLNVAGETVEETIETPVSAEPAEAQYAPGTHH